MNKILKIVIYGCSWARRLSSALYVVLLFCQNGYGRLLMCLGGTIGSMY